MNTTKNATERWDAMLLYAASMYNADMRYATGLLTPSPFIFIKKSDGRKIIVVSSTEYDRAVEEAKAKIDDILLESELVDDEKFYSSLPVRDSWLYAAELINTALKRCGAKNVLVSPWFSYWMGELLKQKGYNIVCDASKSLFPERMIKTGEELKKIITVQRATEEAMAAAIQAIKASEVRGDELYLDNTPLTAERIKTIIFIELIQHGCFAPVGSIVACGKLAGNPHEMGHGVLRPNLPIVIDIFSQSIEHGYWADMTRTVVKGKASKKIKTMYAAVQEAKEYAKSQIRDGASGFEIFKKVRGFFENKGFPLKMDKDHCEGFFTALGHGLGLQIHEPPVINMAGGKIEEGNITTVEPGLYYPGIMGIRLEDIVVVKKNGCFDITEFEEVLEV